MHTAEAIRAASKKDAIRMLQENMGASNLWLLRALKAVFQGQTSDEQTTEGTYYDNGIGFNGCDGKILTSFANQVIAWDNTPREDRQYDCPLSPRQLEITRKRMMKYAGQLLKIMTAAEPVAA